MPVVERKSDSGREQKNDRVQRKGLKEEIKAFGKFYEDKVKRNNSIPSLILIRDKLKAKSRIPFYISMDVFKKDNLFFERVKAFRKLPNFTFYKRRGYDAFFDIQVRIENIRRKDIIEDILKKMNYRIKKGGDMVKNITWDKLKKTKMSGDIVQIDYKTYKTELEQDLKGRWYYIQKEQVIDEEERNGQVFRTMREVKKRVYYRGKDYISVKLRVDGKWTFFDKKERKTIDFEKGVDNKTKERRFKCDYKNTKPATLLTWDLPELKQAVDKTYEYDAKRTEDFLDKVGFPSKEEADKYFSYKNKLKNRAELPEAIIATLQPLEVAHPDLRALVTPPSGQPVFFEILRVAESIQSEVKTYDELLEQKLADNSNCVNIHTEFMDIQVDTFSESLDKFFKPSYELTSSSSCVIDAIYANFSEAWNKHYKSNQMTRESIKKWFVDNEILNQDGDERLSLKDIQPFFEKNKLKLFAYKIDDYGTLNLFHKYEPKHRNKHISRCYMCLLIKDGHAYLLNKDTQSLIRRPTQTVKQPSSFISYEVKDEAIAEVYIPDIREIRLYDFSKHTESVINIYTKTKVYDIIHYLRIDCHYDPKILGNFSMVEYVATYGKDRKRIRFINQDELIIDGDINVEQFKRYNNHKNTLRKDLMNHNTLSTYSDTNLISNLFKHTTKALRYQQKCKGNILGFDVNKQYAYLLFKLPFLPVLTIVDRELPYNNEPIKNEYIYLIERSQECDKNTKISLLQEKYGYWFGICLDKIPRHCYTIKSYITTSKAVSTEGLKESVCNILHDTNLHPTLRKNIPNFMTGIVEKLFNKHHYVQLYTEKEYHDSQRTLWELPTDINPMMLSEEEEKEAMNGYIGNLIEVDKKKYEKNQKLYFSKKTTKTLLQDGFYPIKMMIYNMARLQMYDMANSVLSLNPECTIVKVQTDAIYFKNDDNSDIKYDDRYINDKFGFFKLDKTKKQFHKNNKIYEQKYEHIDVKQMSKDFITLQSETEWKTNPSKYIQEAIKAIGSKNVLILAKHAGAGKTHLCVQHSKQYEDSSNLFITFTNVRKRELIKEGLTNVKTLNKVLKIGLEDKRLKDKRYALPTSIQRVYVEEAHSFPRKILLQLLKIVKINPNVQFILNGDENQLNVDENCHLVQSAATERNRIIDSIVDKKIMLTVPKRYKTERDVAILDLYKNILFNSAPTDTETITLSERVNKKKLKYIIDNIESLADKKLVKLKNKSGREAEITHIKKYFNRIYKGMVNVEYKQRNNMGRYFAKGSLSLQSLSKFVRHTISREYYYDVDIVNAHPTFLAFYCANNNIEHNLLADYIKNRDSYFEYLSQYGYNRDMSKDLIITIINGGGNPDVILSLGDKIIDLYNELLLIRRSIMDKNPSIVELGRKNLKTKNKNDWNLDGTVVNLLMSDMENKVLMAMVEYFKSIHLNPEVLCFDGCMVPKKVDRKTLSKYMRECEHYVESKVGIKIKLAEKEMTQGLSLEELNEDDNDILNFQYEAISSTKMNNRETVEAFLKKFPKAQILRKREDLKPFEDMFITYYNDTANTIHRYFRGDILTVGDTATCVKYMYLKDFDITLQNRFDYEIVDLDQNKDIVGLYDEDEDKYFTMSISQFYQHFTTSIAKTAHSTQGNTYKDKRVIMFDIDSHRIDGNFIYTVMSRVNSLDNFYIYIPDKGEEFVKDEKAQDLRKIDYNLIDRRIAQYIKQDKDRVYDEDVYIDRDWIVDMLEFQDRKCGYCKKDILYELSVDRINNERAHLIDNCILSCRSCNVHHLNELV